MSFAILGMMARRRQARRAESTIGVTDETASPATLSTTTSRTASSSAAATLVNNINNSNNSNSNSNSTPNTPPPTNNISTHHHAPSKDHVASTHAKDTSDTASMKSTRSRFGAKIRKGNFLSRGGHRSSNETTTAASVTPERSPTPVEPTTSSIHAESEAAADHVPPAVSVLPAPVELIKEEEEEAPKSQPAAAAVPQTPLGSLKKMVSATSIEGRRSMETSIVEQALEKARIKRLEEEKAKVESENALLAGEKVKLESENARLVADLKEKARSWEAKREATELERDEERRKERMMAAQRLQDKEEQWMTQLQTQQAESEVEKDKLMAQLRTQQTEFEDEKAALIADFAEKEKAWLAESEDEKRQRDEEMALVERDNESLAARVAELESSLDKALARAQDLDDLVADTKKEREEMNEQIQGLHTVVSATMADVQKLHAKEVMQQQAVADLEDELAHARKEKDASLALRDNYIRSLDDQLAASKKQAVEARTISDQKLAEKDRAIEELKDQMTAYYQYVDATDRRNRLLSDQLKRQSMDVQLAKPADTKRLQIAVGEPLEAAARGLNEFNSEVFQTAASFADAIESDTSLDMSSLADLEPLVVKLAPVMSRDLVYSLRTAYTDDSHEPNTLLLQVALQGCMSYCAERFVNSWYPFQWEQGDLLKTLYKRILDTGRKGIAEKWRSTTKGLLMLTSESHPQLLAYMREAIVDVLAIIGRPASQPQVDALFAEFRESFSNVARLAIRLHILFNDILFNESASCDLAVYIPRPEVEFWNTHMEESYPEGGDSSLDLLADNRVVCATELGLQRTGEVDLVIVKPKVVLSSIMYSD